MEISEVDQDSPRVQFQRPPTEGLTELARDIYPFCPDLIEQYFGCMDDRVEMMEEQGMALPPELAELIESVDFSQENFGEVLLGKSLARDPAVTPGWD